MVTGNASVFLWDGYHRLDFSKPICPDKIFVYPLLFLLYELCDAGRPCSIYEIPSTERSMGKSEKKRINEQLCKLLCYLLGSRLLSKFCSTFLGAFNHLIRQAHSGEGVK